MRYAELHEKTEQQAFDLDYWVRRLETARQHRMSSGWDRNAEEGERIRNNEVPLDGLQAAPDWRGKYYKDNWLWKSIKWLVSMQTGSEIQPEVEGYDYADSMSKDILEQELNLAISRFDLLDVAEDCLYDRYYTGLGVARAIWNTRRVEPMYQTGTPKFQYVSPHNIYLDPACRMKDKEEMRYFFHTEQYDVDELKRRYPKYAKDIDAAQSNTHDRALDVVNVTTVQYKKVITIEKVFLEDQETGMAKEFLLHEWEEFVAETAMNPETPEMYKQSGSDMEYQDWLNAGMFMPEKIVMKGSFESEEPAVFQAIFMEQLRIVLEKPQYVGQKYGYFFLVGYHNPSSAYPLGLAYFMRDMLEASIALMTILMITAARMHKNEKIIQAGSLVNHDEYIQKGYMLGVNPIVDEAWQAAHPGQKAVEYLELPQFPQALAMMNDYLTNAQKTTSGAVDAAIGLASYSGESGVKVAQLQMASRIYQKEELDGFRRFLISGCEWTKDQIIQFRNYPHKIPGLTDDNNRGLIDVATDNSNRLDADQYYVRVTIQENHETLKQIEREAMMNLNERGYVGGIDLMRSLDIPAPEKKYEAAMDERGEKQYVELIRSNPELMQIIDQFIAQQEGQDGQQQIGA